MYHEIKSLLQNDTVFYSLVIVLVAVISFGLGRLSALSDVTAPVILPTEPQKSTVMSTTEAVLATTSVSAVPLVPSAASGVGAGAAAATSDTSVVGSKSGTKYHFPWCPGAKQIKAENLISFTTPLEARARGYTPAANCPGLE